MSADIHGLTDISNQTIVAEIRQMFLAEVDTNPHLYHDIDVERVRCEDWQVERFVIDYQSCDKAYEALVKAMRWKKSYGIHDRSHSYFPKEFYIILGPYYRDREGRVVRWAVGRDYVKVSDFCTITQQFLCYVLESEDRVAGNKGLVALDLLKGAGMRNVNMSVAMFMLEVLTYYPQAIRMGFCVDLPGILSGLAKLLLSLCPKSIQNMIKIIKSDELVQYFDVEEIPVTFGGKRVASYPLFDEMSALYECKHLGFSDKQINNFYDVYKDLFNTTKL